LYKQGRKRPTPMRRQLSRTQALLGNVTQGMGASAGDENSESCGVVRPSSEGRMPARMGTLSAGVGRRHPVAIRKALLMAGSKRRV